MTPNQIKIFYLVKRFRYVHKDEKKAIEALQHILDYSYPIVYSYDDLSAISKAYERRKNKKKRINAYLREMADCYDELYFVTLTWRDEHLTQLSESTRHKYVQTWLNESTRDYYANQDFGKSTEREHYHVVVALKDEPLNPWPYGFINIRKVGKKDEPGTRFRLSTYLLKLTNHAGKLGTGKSFHKRGLKEVDNLPF